MKRGMILAGALFAVLATTAVGCSDDKGATVDVVLSEFIVQVGDAATVEAGEISFVVSNKGGDTHEFLVVKADSAEKLPVDENGAFDEKAFGEKKVIGEVEDIGSRTEKKLTLDLEAGDYLLLCNIVEKEESGEIESHFAEGMHTTFTVE